MNEPVTFSVSDTSQAETSFTSHSRVQPLQPLPTRTGLEPSVPLPPAALRRSQQLFGAVTFSESGAARSLFDKSRIPSVEIISGVEAKSRRTTDVGDLLGKSPRSVGTSVQQRTPIVTDPRVRGSRIGQLAASGSHWVAARIDLDTPVSKIDSRLVDSVVTIGGPYSTRLGPALDFIDIELRHSPRYENGFEGHGMTGFDFGTNGEQWSGIQRLWGGGSDWGFHASYGHSTGNDYRSGRGLDIASSFNSREVFTTFGKDLSADDAIEFTLLRLDQTGVEFPGYVFDMDYLVANGFELQYEMLNKPLFDRLELETWYNDTRFRGNAQNASKRRQFPILDFFRHEGFTEAETMSTGYAVATTWGAAGETQLTAGTDLRHIRQSLDEVASGRIGFLRIQNANSPLPESESTNPGIFLSSMLPVGERLDVLTGARVDWTHTDVTEDAAKLQNLGFNPAPLQSSLSEILGTDRFDQNFATWSAYIASRYALTDRWTLLAAAGHGQRPPSHTELYVAEPFLLLLQNGLNTATGDPLLKPEKKWQLDLGLTCDFGRFQGEINGYHAWINDYITFENMGVFRGPPAGQIEQEWLKFVNTDWAILTGFELAGDLEINSWVTTFGTLRYVEGRDLTRNGSFATRRATPGAPSIRVPGQPRGLFSGIPGSAEEPLPGIVPMESRLGVRLHARTPQRPWGLELSARVVDNQDRIATSLLELPTPGFTTWDVRTHWQPSDRLLLVAGVENIGDRTYREHLDFRNQSGIGIFQPGRNFYFGSDLCY